MLENTVLILTSSGKKGITMDKEKYQAIRNFILDRLTINVSVTFPWLIEEALVYFREKFRDEEIPWLILQVKSDMEGRGIIKKKWEFGRVQVLSIRKNRAPSFQNRTGFKRY
jgi:hypothetical protein